jgi:hypothetical protein
MGCFVDGAVVPRVVALDKDYRFWFDDLDIGIGGAAEVDVPKAGGNILAFSSGWGDGSYPTWVGRTASGQVACFVADMQLFRQLLSLD